MEFDMTQIKCPSCDKENFLFHSFCYLCGSSLADLQVELAFEKEILIQPGEQRPEYISIKNTGGGDLKLEAALTLQNGKNNGKICNWIELKNKKITSILPGKSAFMELYTDSKTLSGGDKYAFELKIVSNTLRGKRDYSEQNSRYWDKWCRDESRKFYFQVLIDRPPCMEVGPFNPVKLGEILKARQKSFERKFYIKNSGGGTLSAIITPEDCLWKNPSSMDKTRIPESIISFPKHEFDISQGKSEYVNFTLELHELPVNCNYSQKFYIKERKSGRFLKEVFIEFRMIPVTPPRPVIGIDFGTSSSKVSAIGRDDIELIKIRGQDTFPSLIYVNERGRVVIGYDASGEAEKEGFIKSIKSILRSGETDIKIHGINRPVAGLVSEFLQRFFQYIIREEVVEKLYGRNLTPHDVELVVTIPVKAKEKHEKTMGEILSKIGFRNVKFLAESTAASQFYLQSDKELSDGKVIVVFDCGAGTTDISILRINLCREDDGSYNRDFTLLAENGIEKGGDHIDNALYDLVKHKLPDAAREILEEKEKDVTGKRLNLLLQEMERIKKAFSFDKSHQTLNLPGLISELKITYDEFEHTIKPLVDEFIDLLYRALDMADVHYMEVNMVYLVGGTTYIPVVQKELERIFTERYISGHNDNDRLICVAKGASMVKLGKTRRVLPFCYGYSVDTNPHVEVLLERGMIYPKENHRTISLLTVEENHIYTDIYIYKGETREELYEGKGTVVGRIICNIEQIGQVRALEVHIEVDERGDVSSYVLYDPQGVNLRFDETGL